MKGRDLSHTQKMFQSEAAQDKGRRQNYNQGMYDHSNRYQQMMGPPPMHMGGYGMYPDPRMYPPPNAYMPPYYPPQPYYYDQPPPYYN